MNDYFVARVSTKGQNLARQLAEAKKMGYADENIFTDEISGRKKERPGTKQHRGCDDMKKIIQRGDRVTFTEIDRVARKKSFSREKIKKKKFSRLLLTIKINRDILVSTKQKGLDTVKINEIISEVLNNTIKQDGRKKTQTDIAAALGVKPQIVNDRLKNENMKVNTAIEMLAEMGYEIVVRPAAASDKRESYIVEKGGPRVR